ARMVLWAAGGPGNEPALINLAPADGAWHDAEVLLNPKMAGHTGLRFQVFVDTVGVNVAIDELRVARVTPWDDHVSPLTYTLFQEMDYDFGTPIYTIPEAVSPLVWRNKARGSLPLAWDFAPDTIDYYPGVMAYFYATRSNKDYFTAANSGAGYVNPSFMPLADRATYIKTSRRAMGRFGESFLSFFLNGLAASPGDDVMQQWNAVAIDGAIANQLVTPSRRMVGNVPWVELDTNGWSYGGIEQAVANKNLELAYNARYGAPPPGSAARFLVGRNIYTGPDMASSILAANRTLHPERDYTAVDPYTFGYLFRRLNGGTNTRRASWMSDDLPRALLPGDKRVVNFAVRNDGWDMWSAAACVLGVLFSTDDDVSPKSGAPLLIPLSKDTAPGEVVKWSAAIDAPTGEGKYTMSYDLRCAGAWFEDANNIVYKDAVEVVAKRDF
nr:hypothetical protein [Polyangiaceae bacterium]